jgi:hypothetical protein
MHSPLHRQHGNAIDFPDYESTSVALRSRAHKTRYLFVRNRDRFLEVVGKTTQPAAQHERDARLNSYS